MTQKGTVIRLLGQDKAEVEVVRGTACGGNCVSCGGQCGGRNVVRAAASNPVGASVGDRVTVQARSASIIGAAALVYLLPLVMFFAGYAAAAAAGLAEGPSILISIIAMLAGVLACVLISRFGIRRGIQFEIIAAEKQS